MDVDQYLQRIGYEGPVAPTLAVLRGLTRAHAQSVPFENVDVLRGLPITLEPAALFDKIVCRHRGGYCFEINGLFLELLKAVGFRVRPLGARVRLGVADRGTLTRRTHLLIQVALDGERWLTDVGVGSASLTAPLLWKDGLEQITPHDRRRIVQDGSRWFHQVFRAGDWTDVYEFTADTMPLVDRVVANWYTSTHPESHFRRELVAALAQADGGRITLAGRQLRFWDCDGGVHERVLDDARAVNQVLQRDFHLDVEVPPRTLELFS